MNPWLWLPIGLAAELLLAVAVGKLIETPDDDEQAERPILRIDEREQ